MRTIASRFVMLVATAAVAPLVLFGAVSVYSLRSSSRQSVIEENLQVAAQAAELIGQYMDHHLSVLQTTAAHLRDTQLEPQQQTQVLINHVIDYEVLRELTLFGPDGAVVATSRLGAPTVQPPPDQPRERSIAPVTVDDDLLPTTTVSLPIASLAISRKIVNQLDGQISVTSTVGHGTTFSVEFARVEGGPDVPTASAAAGSA